MNIDDVQTLDQFHELARQLPPSLKDRYCSNLYSVVIGDAEYNRNDDEFYLYEPTLAEKIKAYRMTV